MLRRPAILDRRQFLRAAGRAVLPLPFLGSLHCKTEKTANHTGHPLVVFRPASGVAQEDQQEPEQFWPRELGALNASVLGVDNADRVVSELAEYGERLLMVRNTVYPFPATFELHAGGGNQLLTGAQCGPFTNGPMTYAMGESIDNWIARQSSINGGEPLALYAGRRDNIGEEVLSYRGPLQLRGAESDPWTVYQRLTGTDGSPKVRGSVNDLVLDQLAALTNSSRISAEDKARLQMHTDSVRDFEVLSERLSANIVAAMEADTGKSALDDYSLDIARMHCDLIALVLACGQATAVTLQVGDRIDRAQYLIKGFRFPAYHTLSHRDVTPDEMGDYATIQDMHAEVNRLHMQVFKYLLDKIDERGLLDQSVVVYVSDVATGSHRYDNLPWVIAGSGDGTLKTGQYVDAGGVTHDRLLATLLTATGHRTDAGDPITRFGDESLPGGLVDAMMA